MHKEFVRRSKECKSIEEMLAKDGPMNFIFKDMIQALLAAEMTEHLGYERSDARSKHTDHARNGTFKKTLKTSTGEVEIEVPRDRKSEFEPTIVPKYQTKTSDLEKKMISMYAKGMTTTNISEHVSDLYLERLT
jgi:putative transposase